MAISRLIMVRFGKLKNWQPLWREIFLMGTCHGCWDQINAVKISPPRHQEISDGFSSKFPNCRNTTENRQFRNFCIEKVILQDQIGWKLMTNTGNKCQMMFRTLWNSLSRRKRRFIFEIPVMWAKIQVDLFHAWWLSAGSSALHARHPPSDSACRQLSAGAPPCPSPPGGRGYLTPKGTLGVPPATSPRGLAMGVGPKKNHNKTIPLWLQIS